MKKKGMSQVIATVVLIALTLALVAAAWGIINTFVNDKLESAGDCSKIFEQIILNDGYTCYDASSNSTLISISREDFNLTSLLISVVGEDDATTFTLTEKNVTIPKVTNYPDKSSGTVLPAREAGKTYCVSGITKKPQQIKIAPKVGKTQCEVVSKTTSIISCVPTIHC